jgi:hypothetical protein
MKKLVSVLVFLAALCGTAFSQTLTTVSGIVTDADGSVWTNATCTVTFIPSPNNPNPAVYTNGGVAVTTPGCNFTASSGSFSFSAGSNASISPTGSLWQISLCPQASSSCQNYQFAAAGGSMSLSAALTASLQAPRFLCNVACYGYSTVEIIGTPIPGTIFTNTTIGSTQGTVIFNSSGVATYPTPVLTDLFITDSGANNIVFSGFQNVTHMWAFYTGALNYRSAKISYSVGTADNTGALYDIGLYNQTGTLVCHTGAIAGTTFAPGTGLIAVPFTSPCALTAATRYYIAMTTNTGVASLHSSTAGILPCVNCVPSVGNATSGGVLNNTITPPADVYASGLGSPLLSLHN